jgi:MFS transporter, MHS family, shikimate and dehydroshikimate transport protein
MMREEVISCGPPSRMGEETVPAPPWKVVISSFLGTVIEWYDFFLYGTAAALVFNELFFPHYEPVAGTMAAFATYAIGFLVRPLGGVVFGHLGDRVGRKSVLVTTLLMMGLSTFLVGLLPTYDKVGVLAPILLVGLRSIQGLALGGEWGGAVLMAVEHAHKKSRGYYSSWAQAGVPVGMVLATGVFSVFASRPEAEFLRWGWRVPFLLGIVLTLVGLFVRISVVESPLFSALRANRLESRNPLLEVLRSNQRSVLLVIGARVAENASFYIFTVFVLSYATAQLGIARSTILTGVLLASVAEFFAILGFGALSDKFGRRPVYLTGTIGLTLFAFPFFWLLNSRNTALVWLGCFVAISIVHAAMYAPQAAFFTEMFKTNVRFSGASLGYQLAAPLAGGVAPMIATALLQATRGKPWPIAIYLVILGLLSSYSVLRAQETHQKRLDEDLPARAEGS